MYKLPTISSMFAPRREEPDPDAAQDSVFGTHDSIYRGGIEPWPGPTMPNPGGYGSLPSQFGTVPNFKGLSAESTGAKYDQGRKGGISVGDAFRMSGTPYTMNNILDLVNYQRGSRSPTNPSGYDSVLHSRHYVDPMSENTRNKFFNKPFDEMSDRGKTNFYAYHPDLNRATYGMTQGEKRAYSKARYGYDNSAYFETRPETKKTFEDLHAEYKPLEERIKDRNA